MIIQGAVYRVEYVLKQNTEKKRNYAQNREQNVIAADVETAIQLVRQYLVGRDEKVEDIRFVGAKTISKQTQFSFDPTLLIDEGGLFTPTSEKDPAQTKLGAPRRVTVRKKS